MPDTPKTALQLQEEQVAEYSKYVALGPIDVNGTRAYNEGDAVPIANVEGEGATVRADQVAKTSTKAGRVAAGVDTDTPKG